MIKSQIRKDLEMVQEQLQIFNDFEPLMLYKITQNFPKHGERTVFACNLVLEFENDMAMFQDAELSLSLIDDLMISNMFLIDYVTDVSMKCMDGESRVHIVLTFDNGTIDISSAYVKESLSQYDEYGDMVLDDIEDIKAIESTYRKYYEANKEDFE